MSMKIRKISGNPRDIGNIWRPRTQEMTGGFNPREMGNYGDLDVNPNENADGLSHHTRQTPEDGESTDQRNSKLRRDRALRELIPGLRHISIRPEDMDSATDRSPMMESENKLLESGLGVDLGADGLSESAGANVGTVRSDTPHVSYGHPSRGRMMVRTSYDVVFSDILKGRRKYKGRRYQGDEDSEDDERKSKAKKKRERRRKGKKGKKVGGKHQSSGGREIKSKSKRRAASARRQLLASARRQSFHPNVHSIPLRMRGSTMSEGIPLRIRDPVAWQRKLANERDRRTEGAMPRGMTHHRSSEAGVHQGATRGNVIGGRKGRSVKLPSSAKVGTSMRAGASVDRMTANAIGDPLGISDYLTVKSEVISKKKHGLTRTELIAFKNKVERMLKLIEKLTKATPELGWEAKIGGQASEDRASAPIGPCTLNDEMKAAYRFDDTSLAIHAGLASKR